MSRSSLDNCDIIAGLITASGELQQGPANNKIDDVRKDGVGLYIVRFVSKYLQPPVVVASQYGSEDGNLASDGGTTRDNVVVVAVDEQSVKFKTGDNNGSACDRSFAFTAVGLLSDVGLQTDSEDKVLPVKSRPTLILAAKEFTRSTNVQVGVLGYGADVIHNAPPYSAQENIVEYDIESDYNGHYELWVEYAAAEERAVKIYFNDTLIKADGLVISTGGWHPQHQVWHFQCVLNTTVGINTLKLYQSMCFPHIRTLKLIPVIMVS